jgi:cell division protein FtsA
MAKAAPEGLITALDIGSSKVSAMIAQPGDGGELIVLGTGQRESRGVKRGYIADMAATEAAVREAVEQAERIAGLNIENVWVGFSAGGLVSDVAEVEFELGGHRVEQGDIDALLAAGRNSIDPQGCTPTGWACTSMSSPRTARRSATSTCASAPHIWR